jgi:hypothetical protein
MGPSPHNKATPRDAFGTSGRYRRHPLGFLDSEIPPRKDPSDSDWSNGLEITEHDLPPELINALFCSEFTDSHL